MYELFIKAIASGWLFLIQVIQNRLTAGSGKILDGIRKTAGQGRVTARIPRDSQRNIKGRGADGALRAIRDKEAADTGQE
jgi:hypothetical protein